MLPPPPRSTLFPYTTLFRSAALDGRARARRRHLLWRRQHAPRSVAAPVGPDRKSTRLNSSHITISYAVFCLKKKTHVKMRLYALTLDDHVHPVARDALSFTR